MKRIAYATIIVLLVIICGMLVIRHRKPDTEITKEKTKVGFILNGERYDHSWGQAHCQGINATVDELNLDVIYNENTPQDKGCIEVMESLIDKGCSIIICDSFAYGDYELEVAKKHPDVIFFHATGVKESSNLATYFGRIYQARYLSGIVAGLQTDSNEIGYVAAFNMSEVNRGINAFTLGVRSVNPKAKVYVDWSQSWDDDDMNLEATKRLLSNHKNIDVFTIHADSSAGIAYANEQKIWTIGYNMDNSDMFPDTYLTAPVWDWSMFYGARIKEVLQGKFISKHYWDGIETGLVDISPLTKNVKPGTREVVEEAKSKLVDGTKDVFYGPIKDNRGITRVLAGESMSDEAMLNEFDWFVEGVILDGE